MLTSETFEPEWLEALLLRAVRDGWCIDINCSTCASTHLREALGLIGSTDGSPRFVPMSREKAEAIVAALHSIQPSDARDVRFEEAARWVIYEVWREHGHDLLRPLDGTWAGEALERMRSHYAVQQERRRLHQVRQGVKKRDWT